MYHQIVLWRQADIPVVVVPNGVDDTHKIIASPDAPSLIVLDKTTGRLVARDDEHIGPNIFHCTWSSPALGEVNGRPLVFFAGGNGVVYAFETLKNAGADVAKLKKVWWFDCDPTAPRKTSTTTSATANKAPSTSTACPSSTTAASTSRAAATCSGASARRAQVH